MEGTQTYLGIDPASYKNLGWCCVVVTGCEGETFLDVQGATFTSPCDKWGAENAWVLYNAVEDLIEQTQPDRIVIERTIQFPGSFVSGQINSTIGLILVAAGKYQVPVEWVIPTHMKKVVVGKGKASKTEVRNSLLHWLNGNAKKLEKSEHCYDAFGAVITWLIDNGIIQNVEWDTNGKD